MSINDPIFLEQNSKCEQKDMLLSSSEEEIVEDVSRNQKKAKRFAIIFIILYIILFPFFFYMGLLSSMVFASSDVTVPIGLLIVFLTLSISLSMLVSIYLMWSRYLRGQYKKIHLFSLVPPLTFVGVGLVIEVLRVLLRYFALDEAD